MRALLLGELIHSVVILQGGSLKRAGVRPRKVVTAVFPFLTSQSKRESS